MICAIFFSNNSSFKEGSDVHETIALNYYLQGIKADNSALRLLAANWFIDTNSTAARRGAAGRRGTPSDFSKCRTGLRSLTHVFMLRQTESNRESTSRRRSLFQTAWQPLCCNELLGLISSRPDVGLSYVQQSALFYLDVFHCHRRSAREKEWAPCRSGVVNRTIHDFITKLTERGLPNSSHWRVIVFKLLAFESAKDTILPKLEGTHTLIYCYTLSVCFNVNSFLPRYYDILKLN